MCAARIFALARVMRRARVASGTRKARAISATVSPATRRRVSATLASTDSAGWQQVKTRRSRSSSTAPVGRAGPSSCRRRACRCLASRLDSRRSRSIARRVAVVVIHPPGLAGMPSRGQVCTAARNASATQSSARSRSPSRRASRATTRAHSSWWTRVIASSTGELTAPAARGPTPRCGRGAPRPCRGTPATPPPRGAVPRRGRPPRPPRSRRAPPWSPGRARP